MGDSMSLNAIWIVRVGSSPAEPELEIVLVGERVSAGVSTPGLVSIGVEEADPDGARNIDVEVDEAKAGGGYTDDGVR